MIQKVYHMTVTDEKTIEKVILDSFVNYLHMVFPKNDGLPVHPSNANLYMTVLRGTLSIALNDQSVDEYHKGDIINIPANTKMNVRNLHDDILELIVFKAPAPGVNCV